MGRIKNMLPRPEKGVVTDSDPHAQGLDNDVVFRLVSGKFVPKDYQKYRKTEHWKSVREAALEHYGHACKLCGRTKRLQVHHTPKGYKHLFREDVEEHLLVICQKCHARHHRKG